MSRRARPVVAIDGPAGAGKSTVATLLAERLGFVRVDTGAIYRSVALAAQEAGVAWDDGAALGAIARSLRLEFEPGEGGKTRVKIAGQDRTTDIRTPEIARGASVVSQHGPVREALLGRQRELGAEGGVVLEGRDIGTVVFPDAEVKIFLTASPQERARRRVGDLEAQGIVADYATTLTEIVTRDAEDEGRAIAPLRPAEDAVQVDTTGLSLPEVVDVLHRVVVERVDRG